MAKSKKGGFFRSFSLPSSRVRKFQRIERNIEERQEEEEVDEEELHIVLRMIKTLAINAKKEFKKKMVYRYYCEEMIDRWIPDLKRLLRIRSREERRQQEEEEAQRENDRRETQRELRNFSKDYDYKRNRTDEVAALKNKHEDELVRQKKEHDDAMTALKREHQKEMDRLLAEKEKLLTRTQIKKEMSTQTNEDERKDLPEGLATLKEERYTALQRLKEMEKEVARLSIDTHLVGKDISKKMDKLYDKEWLISKEVLEKNRDKKSAIEILLIVLMKCFNMCRKYANDQHNAIIKALMLSEQIHPDSPFAKFAKDMQKAASFRVISNSCLLNEVKKEIETLVGQLPDDCDSFINKSVKYCWLMCVQDPSIYLDDYGRGLEINPDDVWYHEIYTEYLPNFVVWPGIYEYKNGPLLSKGVIYADNRRTKQAQRTPQKTQQTRETNQQAQGTNQQTHEIYRGSQISQKGVSKRRRSEEAKRSSAPDPKLQKTDAQSNENEDPKLNYRQHTPYNETAI